MSKPKYEKGKQIRSVSQFAKSNNIWFKVNFGNGEFRTVHKSFVISLQYRVLEQYINKGNVFEAKSLKTEK